MGDSHTDISHYRALVHKTASLILGHLEVVGAPWAIEDDFDDLVQTLWIKCWRAMGTYDAEKSRMTQDTYVFMCMTNQVKDIRKRRRRGGVSLEALTDDLGLESVDQVAIAHLQVDCEVVYAEVEDTEPLLPNTLSVEELAILALLAQDYRQTEAAVLLGIEKRDMERAMRSIRAKMADWKPTAEALIAPIPVVV